MTQMINRLFRFAGKHGGIKAVLATAAMTALPSAALAHHGGGLQLNFVVPGPVVVDPQCAPPVETRVWVEPIYRTVSQRQWVDADYQTVAERVWVPTTTTASTQHVWMPDRYGWRDVETYEWGRRYLHREWVLVEAGHYEDVLGPAVCVPGHYEDVQRQQLVCDGHWAMVDHQELVAPGHWETRVADSPPVVVQQPPSVVFGLQIPLR
jgi:hypothetical protein